jgi:arylsulfatase A-like enzyme
MTCRSSGHVRQARRSRFVLLLIVLAIAARFAGLIDGLCLPAYAGDAPPNIILIVADDQGWTESSVRMDPEIPQSQSDFYQTPNLEALAAAGLRFSNAYASSPMCSSTRVSLVTGKSSAQVQITDVRNPGKLTTHPYFVRFYNGLPLTPPVPHIEIPVEEVSIAERIKASGQGYYAGFLGKYDGWPYPNVEQFDEHAFTFPSCTPEGEDPKEIFSMTNCANRFIEQRVLADQPFFLQLSYYAIHASIEARADTIAKYASLPPGERHDNVGLAAMLEDLDAGVGMVLEKIQELGIEDNTYILYTSDNGAPIAAHLDVRENEPLFMGKGSIWEGGLRVPLIIKGPGIEAGAVSGVPVVSMDLYATISELAGTPGPLPEGVEGASLSPVLFNQGQLPPGVDHLQRQYAENGELFFHFPHYDAETSLGKRTPGSAIRDGDYKLVRIYGENNAPDQYFLFNLAANVSESLDPDSELNLADEMPEKTAELKAKLERWLDDVDASLPYQVWDNVALEWDASRPGSDPNGWRSTIDVDYKDRETWTLGSGGERPQVVDIDPHQPGLPQQAFHFAGDDSMTRKFFHVSDAKLPDLYDNDHSASFEFWIRTEALQDEQILFEAGGTAAGISLTLGDADGDGDAADFRFRVLGASGNHLTVDGPLDTFADPTRDFVHLVAVLRDAENSRGAEVYVNGALVSRVEGLAGAGREIDWDDFNAAGLGGVGGVVQGSEPQLGSGGGAGGQPFAGGRFVGDIALFRFFNHVLQADVIRDSYNSVLHDVDLGIVKTTGGVLAADSRPVDVSEGMVEWDDSILVMQERLDSLDAPLPVDILAQGGGVYGNGDGAVGAGGILGAGTEFTSYLLHFDPLDDPLGFRTLNGSVRFSEKILAVLFEQESLGATDPLLGSLGKYASGQRTVDLFGTDWLAVSNDLRTLSVEWTAGSAQVVEVRVLTEPYSPLVGDLDCDGDVDFDDIAAFILGLSDPQQYEQQFGLPPTVKGDADGDGDLDFDDTSGFVLLVQSAGRAGSSEEIPLESVPEPPGFVLFLLAITSVAASRAPAHLSFPWRRRRLRAGVCSVRLADSRGAKGNAMGDGLTETQSWRLPVRRSILDMPRVVGDGRLSVWTCASALVLLVLMPIARAIGGGGPPNIILIMADDQGWNGTSVQLDPNVPGSRSDYYQTPTLEALAAQGLRFSRAYSAAPVCAPTRASIVTGKSPAQLQLTDVFNPDDSDVARAHDGLPLTPPTPIPPSTDEVSLARRVKQADPNYVTGQYGKWHLALDGFPTPTDMFYDFEADSPGIGENDPKASFALTNFANNFMADRVSEGRPFYLQLWHRAVHDPVRARPETIAKYESLPPGTVHTSPEFAAMTEDLDTAVGLLMEQVRHLGIEENTYLIYTSDNGAFKVRSRNTPLRGGKAELWEGGIRVPLIIKGPGIQPGMVSDVPVISHDLFTTISALAGSTEPLPEGVEGASLVPILGNAGELPPGVLSLDRPYGENGELFFHSPHNYGIGRTFRVRPGAAVVHGDYKLIRLFGETGQPDTLMLYDIHNDIGETTDLAASMPEMAADLNNRLQTWLDGVDAPMPYDVATDVELVWDAAQPGTRSNEWRSTVDVNYKARETWTLRDGEQSPQNVAVRPYQKALPTGAFRFDGGDGMVRKFFHVGDATARLDTVNPGVPDFDRSTTLEFWIRLDTLSSEQILLESGEAERGLSLTFGDADGDGSFNDLRFRVRGDVPRVISVTAPLDTFSNPLRDFVHVVAVLNDSETERYAELYVNGALSAHVDGIAGIDESIRWDAFDDACLGASAGSDLGGSGGSGDQPFSGGNFRGDIAFWRYYNRALSGSDVTANYNSMLHAAAFGVTRTTGDLLTPEVRPNEVGGGVLEANNQVLVIHERNDVLDAPLSIDILPIAGETYTGEDLGLGIGGILQAGTGFSSYFIHFDPMGEPASLLSSTGSVRFSQPIRGILATQASLVDSDALLGSIGRYGGERRGLDGLFDRSITLSEDLRTLTISWQTLGIESVQLRVLTESVNALIGDMNWNGIIDFDDISPFTLSLFQPEVYESMYGYPPSIKGDSDGDGDLDFDDISGMVVLLSTNLQFVEAQSVPEPSSLSISLIALIACPLLANIAGRFRRPNRRGLDGMRYASGHSLGAW